MTLKHFSRYYKSKMCTATSLVVQWLRLCASKAGSLGSISGHKTRSCTLQLRVCMPQLKLPHAVTKTQCSQIRKYIYFKKCLFRLANSYISGRIYWYILKITQNKQPRKGNSTTELRLLPLVFSVLSSFKGIRYYMFCLILEMHILGFISTV